MTEPGGWHRVRAAIARRATPRVILAVGYAVFLLYAYPGYMTTESADQLGDARLGSIIDWYSPAMSEVWRLVECVVSGPFGMLALQSLLFLGGAYHLLRGAMPARSAAIAACGLLVFPPVLAPMAVIWRDGQMAGYLLAGAAAIASPRRAIRIVGLGLLCLACAMRGTAAFAALPVVVLGFTWRDGQRWWLRGAIAAAVWAAIAIAAIWINDALVDAVTEREAVACATQDILGVLRRSEPIDDAELARELAGTGLTAQHGIQASAAALYARPAAAIAGPDRLFDLQTPAARAALLAARRALVRDHRGAYLAERWHVFYRVLGFASVRSFLPVYTSPVERPEHRAVVAHAATHGWLQRRLVGFVRWLGRGWLFRPYLYLAAALVLLPVAVLRRDRSAAMMAASGIAYQATLFVVATTAEYRSSHWMIACTVLAAMLLFARRVAPPG